LVYNPCLQGRPPDRRTREKPSVSRFNVFVTQACPLLAHMRIMIVHPTPGFPQTKRRRALPLAQTSEWLGAASGHDVRMLTPPGLPQHLRCPNLSGNFRLFPLFARASSWKKSIERLSPRRRLHIATEGAARSSRRGAIACGGRFEIHHVLP